MLQTFNCGIGGVLIVDKTFTDTVLEYLKASKQPAFLIGSVEELGASKEQVLVSNLIPELERLVDAFGFVRPDRTLTTRTANGSAHQTNGATGGQVVNGSGTDGSADGDGEGSETVTEKVKVAVLISGSGTNLQSLIDWTLDPRNESVCRIALVISNVPGVFGLERAKKAGIPAVVCSFSA